MTVAATVGHDVLTLAMGAVVRLGQLIGRLPIILGQVVDLIHVGFPRPLGTIAQDQFLDELLA
jgi:hypothetical protein